MSLVTLEISGDYVAIIRLNRPEAKNAFSREFLASFWKQIQVVNGSDARAVLIIGVGDSFSAGADLKERAAMDETEVFQFLDDIRECFLEVEDLRQPSIACLNGYAFGGGLELALSCDLRYAAESCIVGLTETKLGIIPGAGGTQRLSRIIGTQRAMEWITRAKKISATEGKSSGLYLDIFPDAEFEASCLRIARDIASSAPIAVRAAKKAIRGPKSDDLKSELTWERECYLETIRTKDRTEALNAFREKRKPNFIGE